MASKEVYPKDAIKALRKLGFSIKAPAGLNRRSVDDWNSATNVWDALGAYFMWVNAC